MLKFPHCAALATGILAVCFTLTVCIESSAAPAAKSTKKEAKKDESNKASKSATSDKKKTVVRLTISGSYPEGPSQPGLFEDLQTSLSKIISRLDEASKDKNVSAIWLRIEDAGIGRGKINEIRAAIAKVRKQGKPIYAEVAGADTSEYLIASACDEVFMPTSGMLLLPGVRAEVTFFKGLLDKLGLQFDALQMGKYKGAAEPMTRTSMSGPLRESYEALVDDFYEYTVSAIAESRKMKDYQVKTLMDQGMFSASMAKKSGLVDEVLYADEIQALLKKRLKAEQLEVVTSYKKKQIDNDFSGLGGMMKLMELLSGGKPSEKSSNKQKIAVVYAVGEIVEGKGEAGMFGESAIGSTTMVETLAKAFADPKVLAIVLRIDSPGGSATASDLIWRETVRTKKPMIASMSNVAASGGYYIAMGAKKIFAEPGTITGSIGVIGGKLVTGGLYQKLGLNTEIISRGKNSGALSSSQPFTADERKAWTGLLQETYGQFVGKAAAGRKLPVARIEELAQGRVYTGRQAKKLGLIDELGTLEDAIAEAKAAAGLKPDADVEIQILPKAKTIFEQLFGDPANAELETVAPELAKLARQARVWRQMFGQKVLLWMPYQVDVK